MLRLSPAIYRTDEFAEFNRKYALGEDFDAALILNSGDSCILLKISVQFIEKVAEIMPLGRHNDISVKLFIEYSDESRHINAVLSKIRGASRYLCDCFEVANKLSNETIGSSLIGSCGYPIG